MYQQINQHSFIYIYIYQSAKIQSFILVYDHTNGIIK